MDDSELLAASAGGDPEAFAAFYRRHLGAVVSFCRNATGSGETAADLTAEVFAAALSGAARYRPEQDSAIAWLRGIARNKLLDSRRRGRVEDATRRKLQMAPLAIEDDDLLRVEELAAIGDPRERSARWSVSPPTSVGLWRRASCKSAATRKSPQSSSARSPLFASGSAVDWHARERALPPRTSTLEIHDERLL